MVVAEIYRVIRGGWQRILTAVFEGWRRGTGATDGRTLLGFLLLALSGPAMAAESALEYPLYRVAVAPLLDGKIEGDPGWQGVPVATGFFRLGGGYTAAKQTEVRAAWDGRVIYLGIHCEEPDIALIEGAGKDGGELWSEDGVEVFVRPEGVAGFHQFIVNTAGARRAAGLSDGTLEWQAAASRSADAYTLEVALPLALFGEPARAGSVWRGNFCRNIFTTQSGGDRFTTWAPLAASFHEWERFARWHFRDESPDPAAVPAREARLNGAYRAHLRAEAARLSKRGNEYLPVLRKAMRVSRFEEPATQLIREWEEAARISRLGRLAPAPELRRAVAASERLVERSFTLKYEFLFWELFSE